MINFGATLCNGRASGETYFCKLLLRRQVPVVPGLRTRRAARSGIKIAGFPCAIAHEARTTESVGRRQTPCASRYFVSSANAPFQSSGGGLARKFLIRAS